MPLQVLTNKQLKADARKAYHSHWRRGKVSSSTPGKMKRQDTCQASRMDKFFAKVSRAYKHPGYQAWLDSHRIR